MQLTFFYDLKTLIRFYSGGAFLLPEVLPEMEEATTRGGGGGYRGGGGGGCKCFVQFFRALFIYALLPLIIYSFVPYCL